MKQLIFTLVAAFSLTMTAQADIKIVTVSMERLFDGYYKAQEGMERIQAAADNAQQQADAHMREGQALVQELENLMEQLENPALSEERKEEIRNQAQRKQGEVQAKQMELNQWQRETTNALQQRNLAFRTEMIDDIKRVVKRQADSIDATLVLDTSDILDSGVPPVLFADPALDITDRVLTELNRDAPDDLPAGG